MQFNIINSFKSLKGNTKYKEKPIPVKPPYKKKIVAATKFTCNKKKPQIII